MFRGKVLDCFEMPGKGLVVMLSEVEGTPAVGGIVSFLGGQRTIVDIGRGAAEGAVILNWTPGSAVPTGIGGATVEEIKLL